MRFIYILEGSTVIISPSYWTLTETGTLRKYFAEQTRPVWNSVLDTSVGHITVLGNFTAIIIKS